MAQLPPRAPNMTQNWPLFQPQMMHLPNSFPKDPISAAAAAQQPSWVDEFLDFSSARRSNHRRSASDSIAFLPLLEDCSSSPPPAAGSGFEGMDDEQFLSMFADEEAAPPKLSTSNPSSSNSDENCNGGEKTMPVTKRPKEEPREGDISSLVEAPAVNASNAAVGSGDIITDPKRVKRILANRQSAQRSRVRKLQYISELERSVTSLQSEVSSLSPRVAFLDHQRLVLTVDNSALKQRMAALMQDKIFKDAHQEALRKEIERLRQLYHDQNLKKMAATEPPPTTSDNSGGHDGDEHDDTAN